MPNYKEPDCLLGKRFVTDFRVLAIADDKDRTVTLAMFDERYTISFEELQTIIESGFVVEAEERVHRV